VFHVIKVVCDNKGKIVDICFEYSTKTVRLVPAGWPATPHIECQLHELMLPTAATELMDGDFILWAQVVTALASIILGVPDVEDEEEYFDEDEDDMYGYDGPSKEGPLDYLPSENRVDLF
jgi:hypothetical protein